MIIWGWRGLKLSDGAGQFHCPQCNDQRAYKGVKVQRFFTLYFIPLIPLEVAGRSVQCQTCRAHYRPDVLRYDPIAEREGRQRELAAVYRNVLVHFGRMSGSTSARYHQAVADRVTELTQVPITVGQVSEDFGAAPLDLSVQAVRMAPMLTDKGREMVIQGARWAAGRDTPAKQEALAELSRALGMTEAHFRGVIAEAWPGGGAPQRAGSIN